ncbi:MAG: SdpI family protein [Gemmataceae bacterium]
MWSRWFLASLVVLTLASLGTVYVSVQRDQLFPERVPTHWGIDGQPDAFTPREALLPWLWLMPGVLLGLLLLSRVLPWLSPKNFDLETFRPTYEYIFFLVALLLVYLHLVILLAQMEWLQDLGRWLLAGLCGLFASLGNVLGKVRKNFFVGIRTPWTLASDTVWEATHRLGAWCFVAGGLLGLLLLLTPLHPMWVMLLVLLVPLVPVAYSLWLYKRLQAQGRLEQAEIPN